MSKGWAGGSTYHWRNTVRPAVFARDGYRCRLALPGTWTTRTGQHRRCLGVAQEVHHKHGITRCAGCKADDLDHLVSACRPCNLKLGDPGRVAVRPQIKRMTQW